MESGLTFVFLVCVCSVVVADPRGGGWGGGPPRGGGPPGGGPPGGRGPGGPGGPGGGPPGPPPPFPPDCDSYEKAVHEKMEENRKNGIMCDGDFPKCKLQAASEVEDVPSAPCVQAVMTYYKMGGGSSTPAP